MSDFPSPPPPPPPGQPPPGYVAYGTPAVPGWSKPVRGLAKALVVLQVLSVVGAATVLVVTFGITDSAKDFNRGVSTDFDDEIGAFLAAVAISGLIGLAATIVLIVWSFRIASNIRLRDPSLTWKPGLTIVAWLLTGCFGILPFLMLREHWKKSSAASSAGEPVSPLIVVWFVLSICQVAAGVTAAGVQGASGGGGFGQDTDDVAERLSDQFGYSVASGVLAIASAVVLILVIRQLTDRHARFTGES